MDHINCREDAAGATGESILWLLQFGGVLRLNRKEIDTLVPASDAVRASRFLREDLRP